jgi:hypothetical protein
MNDWLRQQINTAGSLFPVLTNQALDQNKINTPLEEAQKTTINQQQQEINQQKQELETQAKVNTGQALLLQGYQTEQETSRKENLVNDLMSGLNTKEYGLITKALQTLEHLNDSDNRHLPIYFAKTESRMLELKNSTGLFDIPLNDVKEITGGDETLANKLIKFVLDYNNLPEQKVTLQDRSVGYRIELEKPEKKNFSLNDLTLDLPKVTEGENSKGSPIINLDGIPYPNDTQKQAEIDNRKTVLEQIKGKVFPAVATLLIGTGIGGIGINSISSTPVEWIPDLTPNAQVSVTSNHNTSAPTIKKTELSEAELLKIRSESFQKVEVKPGDGYTQLMERHLGADLKELGINKITPDDKQLAVAVNLSQAMTNLNSSTNPQLNLQDLTNPNMIQKIPEGTTKVYIPKPGVLVNLIQEQQKTPTD